MNKPRPLKRAPAAEKARAAKTGVAAEREIVVHHHRVIVDGEPLEPEEQAFHRFLDEFDPLATEPDEDAPSPAEDPRPPKR